MPWRRSPPLLDTSTNAAALLLAMPPADGRAARKVQGQASVTRPRGNQLVDSAEATEDDVEAYPVLAGLTVALNTRPGAGIVMVNRNTSDDWANSGNGRPSDSISSMMMPTSQIPLARRTSAAEVERAAAGCPTSSCARNRKAAAAARNARPRRSGCKGISAQDEK